MTPTHYYVVEAVLPWSSAQVDGKPITHCNHGSVGFCAVFDDPSKAEKFAEGMGWNVRRWATVTRDTDDDGRQQECSYPDCGCPGHRLCMAKSGANSAAFSMNRSR